MNEATRRKIEVIKPRCYPDIIFDYTPVNESNRGYLSHYLGRRFEVKFNDNIFNGGLRMQYGTLVYGFFSGMIWGGLTHLAVIDVSNIRYAELMRKKISHFNGLFDLDWYDVEQGKDILFGAVYVEAPKLYIMPEFYRISKTGDLAGNDEGDAQEIYFKEA
jgi:hypothetical protein